MTEKEEQLMEEDFGPAIIIDCLDINVERITMVNLFDAHKKNYHM